MAFLTAEALDLGHGHAFDAGAGEGVFYLIEFGGLIMAI